MLHKLVRAHATYGKSPLDAARAYDIAARARQDVHFLGKRLDQEVKLEKYLSNEMGHDDWYTPTSFDQALVDYDRTHYHPASIADADKAELKQIFRIYAVHEWHIPSFGLAFIMENVPSYLNNKLYELQNSTKAQGAQAIEGLKQLLPREIVREILSTLWAVFQSGLRPKPHQD